MDSPSDQTVDAVPPQDSPTSGPVAFSIVHTLGGNSRVQLRPPVDEPDTAFLAGAGPETTNAAQQGGRYRLLGEIGRGGMGAILKGHDVDLGRDIAVKLILQSHQHRPEVLQRFIEEAHIGGQLQHPGIVPVYELGQLADERLYFTMKLVKGQTLAQLLAESKDPAQERPRYLKIFEQICQTMGYAHARGVIHRDLKPANVMVGAFGEVQVMDWGLAKVLPTDSAADVSSEEGADTSPPPESDSGASGSHTMPGSVMGTPAYMAPEQARGEVARLDERCDVFGLGAILCDILTGQPPFVNGADSNAFQKAIRGDVADAFTRLDGCSADAELVRLAKLCLTADREERPRSAGVLATELSAYLNSVEQRLRQAELAGVEARAKADEERRRRELTLAAQKELQRALTRQVAERLDGELGRLEMVAKALAALVELRDDWEESELIAWKDTMLRSEDCIFGLCLAFELGQFRPDQVDYGLYQYRGGKDGEIQTKHLIPPKYPYRDLSWYTTARDQGRALWTEPFVDTEGGDIPMVCYTIPLRRAGQVIGVASLDLSVRYFERLGGWLKELDFGQRSYDFVLSREGVFISHPNAAFDFATLASANLPPRNIRAMAGADVDFRALTDRILTEDVGLGTAIDPTTQRPATWRFARVHMAGWIFVVVIDESEAE